MKVVLGYRSLMVIHYLEYGHPIPEQWDLQNVEHLTKRVCLLISLSDE